MRAFFAYPSEPNIISACIRGAVDRLRISEPSIQIHLWERHDISGRPLTQPIITNVEESDCVIADITRLNFNVIYEIGYAIARRKRVFLLRNVGIKTDSDLMKKVGLFDTLGYTDYENSLELEGILEEIDDLKPLQFSPKLNSDAPIFLIETPVRSDALLRISSRVKKITLKV
jgi:hypothetical protein